jgi:hypothetical protein
LLPVLGANTVGCGGGSSNSGTTTSTTGAAGGAAGSYGFVLNGTDSVNNAITASTAFTLTVK